MIYSKGECAVMKVAGSIDYPAETGPKRGRVGRLSPTGECPICLRLPGGLWLFVGTPRLAANLPRCCRISPGALGRAWLLLLRGLDRFHRSARLLRPARSPARTELPRILRSPSDSASGRIERNSTRLFPAR